MCTVRRINRELLHQDLCPLCHRPLRIEYGRTRPSAQQDHPARTWITGRHCDICKATRPQQFWDLMRALRELTPGRANTAP
ncbi:hypothetical protein [Streptomyces clavuligerus]|uniref:Uncharacterized protein n=1 Tax=Streptomyces clavuligerus TaxID=1901 RepID=Q6TMV0_STRCL|nr:hypothetical protein [Streptomyces clavuligerus]AAQ93522.1 hypothetical protein pSCL2.2.26.14 [Streptomyces clavuligerus]AXU16788.1 hypothetical protein D1794_28875 [Streptomyces clavuligerus]EDY48815.1 conserved hypothetical protein [Streptomyces clavuligerus]MBY6300917.1 hypothetical protein [Streptomyces clavuligerus]QPJ97065.1 hypothetical protein GE265_28580 [Streptomyces clavuligerus]